MTEDRSYWKAEICRLAVIMALALTALWLLITVPSVPVLILSVLVIGGVAWYAEGLSKPKDAISTRNKAVFITGCDSGLGQALAQVLDEFGVQVFAGCQQERAESALVLRNKASDRLQVLPCDVTSDEQVLAAAEQVAQGLGNNVLWGVVNAAGETVTSDVELTSVRQFSAVHDVSFLGSVRVTKAFLPLIRQSRGRIVNVMSLRGCLPCPFTAAHASASSAGAAFSDVLRMEMARFGVGVSIVEVGNYSGAMGVDDMDAERTCAADVSRVAHVIEDALFGLAPRSRYLVTGGTGFIDFEKVKTWLKPWLPDRLMDRISHHPTLALRRTSNRTD